MSIKNRLISLDILRGLAAFLVVLGHSLIVYPIDILQFGWCSNLKFIIYSFHMPLFFFVSGCVYKCDNYFTYLKSKLIRIGIPFLLFCFFDVFFHIVGGSLVHESYSILEGLKSVLTLQVNWFLPCILIILIIYPFFDKIIKNRCIVFAASIFMICLCNKAILPGSFQIYNVCYYFIFFVLGVLFKEKIYSWLKTKKIFFNSLLLILSLLFIVIFSIAVYKQIEDLLLLKICLAVAYISFLIILLCLIERRESFVTRIVLRPFIILGRYSLQIYLFNGYLLVLFRYIFINVLKIYNPFAIVFGLTSLIILVSLLLCFIFERIPFIRLLFGLRKEVKAKNV